MAGGRVIRLRRATGASGDSPNNALVETDIHAARFFADSHREAFEQATAWLTDNGGHVDLLDIGWADISEDHSWELSLYFHPK